MNWYVMSVFPNKEKSIKEKIEKEIEIRDLTKYVSRILIPKEKHYQIKSGKKIKTERNYMPGYLMIECEMNGELLRRLLAIVGVVSFLGKTNPIPMREREVIDMLDKFDDLVKEDVALEDSILVGQKVKIIDGAFKLMYGTVTNVNKDKMRVMLNVSIFNRITPIELSFEQIDIN